MIELRNICKELAGRTILKDVSLTIERGQTLVIVGSSGAGKSVMLRHMLGLLSPDSGDVFVDGRSVCTARGRELEAIRAMFGVLFQSGALINWMSVFDNVALPLYEKTSLGDADVREKVEHALSLVGLTGAGPKMPSELSGGMKKRAGLARALILEPRIVLYDEPTSGLDPILSRNIDQLILQLQQELGMTSVVVTHDLVSAFSVADQIALLHEGTIAELAAPTEFRASGQRFVQEFIRAQFPE